ncbi:MAG: hypothetical protein QOE70_4331 [Chthoniobacter sp.]|jgi:hypothetical protein|nr:hypothetical protein [Chthoniobacter sp.]
MNAETIKDLLEASPFVPFTVHLPGRPPVLVPHPDFAFIAPFGRAMLVYREDGLRSTWLDIPLITQIEPVDKPGRRKKGST